MDERTRMFRVLTSLALAMVSGGGLLFWLEPDAGPSIPLAPSQRAAQYAERAVSACPTLAQPWRAVTIVPLDSRQENRSLAAVPQRDDLHFVVACDGSIKAEGLWLAQCQARGDTGGDGAMIRVGMYVQPGDQPMGTDQFEGLRALWTTLNDRIAHSGGTIPLTLQFADAGQFDWLSESIASDLLESQVEG